MSNPIPYHFKFETNQSQIEFYPPPSSMASNRALPNDSVVVISPQYCAPRQVDLYIAKKVKKVTEGRHLGAFDINDNNIFKVKTSGFFGSRLILFDAVGVPVVSLKSVTFSPNDRWKIYRGDSTGSKDLLFSVKKSQHPIKFKTELDVFLSSNTTEDLCDFKISQTYSENSCVIYRGDSDNIIAEVYVVVDEQKQDCLPR
ncbi:hypothetical protein MKW98_020712 [Papaver atlanticum]|uniref:Uncharacterized protein n=1 Tax=Papaver atlanticum TaxID=357466 RepID=A0AAD4XWV0_9MAGN|nr:hypothetical protein MKW98_020712 [Papaver atlanticum]